MSEIETLRERVAEMEKWYFLVSGIVKAAKQVLAKQNPKPLMVDKGLAFEEWKLYIAIEEYERVMAQSNNASTLTAGTSRQNGDTQPNQQPVKQVGSPLRR
jgi:hypothetical protein